MFFPWLVILKSASIKKPRYSVLYLGFFTITDGLPSHEASKYHDPQARLTRCLIILLRHLDNRQMYQ